MTPAQKRDSLRAETLHRREQMLPELRATLSQQIVAHCVDWMQAEGGPEPVMLYLSMRSEVETIGLLEQLLRAGRQVCAPVINMRDRQLIPRQLCDVETTLVRHPYGMLEPKANCPMVSPSELRLIFVPGIAFDSEGYRLGYGMGFYDKFLPQCPDAVRVGLAYQAQVVSETFPQSWDVPVHRIFTENGAIIPRQRLCQRQPPCQRE